MGNAPEGNGNGNGRNGRNVALPDENRPSWRPQDEHARNRRVLSEEDDRFDDDRYGRIHWEDRDRRDWERHAFYEGRNHAYPGSLEDRARERMLDERFGNRGGSAYYERNYHGAPRGYGYSDGDRPSPNLGTGGAMHREHSQPQQPSQSQAPSSWSPSQNQNAPSGHRGKGPQNYQRADDRIRELVCEALTEDDRIDATHIEVAVKNGEVTLSGSVDDRQMKRFVEDVVEGVWGVSELQNLIRVSERSRRHS